MAERMHCLVPGCRHTRGIRKGETRLPGEWICGDHWRLVPRYLRARRTSLWRRYRLRLGDVSYWEYPSGSPNRLLGVRLMRLEGMAWDACKRKAVERAMGI